MSKYLDNKELFLGATTTQYGNHMVMTNVMKPGKTKYINIDTRFREDYYVNTLSKQNVSLPERYTDVRSISVVSAEIPMSYYNISSALGNNAFKVTTRSDPSKIDHIKIPDGQYTLNELISNINTLSSIIIQTVSIDSVTKKINLNTTAGAVDPIFDFTINENGNRSRFDFKSSLGWLLGFRKPIVDDGTEDNIASSLPSIGGPRYLYLVVDEFTSSGNQSSFVSPLPNSLINKNILARISVSKQDYPFGSILPANLSNGLLITDVRSYTGKVDIQKLNIQLVNEFGNVIDLNGDDFSFCLKIEHE
jgi:hypothetical protein